jgi:hypothetical protein
VYQNWWNAAKTVSRGELIAINIFEIKNISHQCDIRFHLRKLGKNRNEVSRIVKIRNNFKNQESD